MRTHGGLTEDSRTNSLRAPIGKGREGKWKGREGLKCVSHASLVSTNRPAMRAATRSRGVGDE